MCVCAGTVHGVSLPVCLSDVCRGSYPREVRHSCLSQACCLHPPKQSTVLSDDRSRGLMSIITAPPDWQHVDTGSEKEHGPANHKRNLNANRSLR